MYVKFITSNELIDLLLNLLINPFLWNLMSVDIQDSQIDGMVHTHVIDMVNVCTLACAMKN